MEDIAMRMALIEASSWREAVRLAPWAAKFARVEGGYMAFESLGDYQVWRGQK